MAQRPLDRTGLGAPESWDAAPTIHPFLLAGPNGPLSAQDTLGLHRLMGVDLGGWARAVGESPARQAAANLRVQLGQPVACGVRDGQALSALRLCASARLAVEALGPDGRGTQAVIDEALAALDKTAWLTRRMTATSERNRLPQRLPWPLIAPIEFPFDPGRRTPLAIAYSRT